MGYIFYCCLILCKCIIAFECGTWQNNYTTLHSSILSNKTSARYLISVAGQCGLCDNLTGLITQFLFAILTGRAFQRFTYGNLARFEDVYWSPHIQWVAPELPESVYSWYNFTYSLQILVYQKMFYFSVLIEYFCPSLKPPYQDNFYKKASQCSKEKLQNPVWESRRYYPM